MVGQLHPLADLDAIHSDHAVCRIFSFEVEGKATAHGDGARIGLIIRPVRGVHITEPLPRRARGTNKEVHEDVDADEEEEEEEKISVDIIASKNEELRSESSAVSDTAEESVSSDCNSNSGQSEDENVPTLPLAQRDGARELLREKKAPLWANDYFYIVDNTGHPDVKIIMRNMWAHDPCGGMGTRWLSKTVTPAHYDESRDNPTRSLLLVRAWMLWRVEKKSWVFGDPGKQRHFAE